MKKLKGKEGQAEHTAEFLGGAADAPETVPEAERSSPPRRREAPKRKYATYYMLEANIKRVKAEARRNRESPVHVLDRALAMYFRQTVGGANDSIDRPMGKHHQIRRANAERQPGQRPAGSAAD